MKAALLGRTNGTTCATPEMSFLVRRSVLHVLAESSASLARDQRLVRSHLQLLRGPSVAIGTAEPEERSAIVLVEHRDLAALEAAIGQFLAGTRSVCGSWSRLNPT